MLVACSRIVVSLGLMLPLANAGNAAQATGQNATDSTAENVAQQTPRTTRVIRLNHTPVMDAAKSIERVMGSGDGGKSSLILVPVPISNSLIVSGPAEAVERVGQLTTAIDVEQPTVTIEVAVAESDDPGAGAKDPAQATNLDAGQRAAFLKERNLKITYRTQIVTLNNQPCFAKYAFKRPPGDERPDRTAVASRAASEISVGITPRVDSKGAVVMEFDLELAEAEPAGKGGKRPSTVTQQSTLSIDDGKTLVVGGLRTGPDALHEILFLVSVVVGDAK